MKKTGFTLVELLIVIGILAILTAAVVVILNPAELLRQARDSQRFSDLDSIKNAVSLYLADVNSGISLSGGTTICYAYAGASTTSFCGGRFAVATTVNSTNSSSRVTTGSGWLPVNFSAISGGSPLTTLPIDPSHGTTYYYAYAGDNSNLTFEINARLESAKYATIKSASSSDGGNADLYYEVGNDPGLDM
jgi:prepilin-type N-terminal cleavage/methylation domain-containing protein